MLGKLRHLPKVTTKSVWVSPVLSLSPVPLLIYHPLKFEVFLRQQSALNPFRGPGSGKPDLTVTSPNARSTGVKRARTPPAASLVTSLRRAEAARPRPLNKAFRGRARQCEEWGGACVEWGSRPGPEPPRTTRWAERMPCSRDAEGRALPSRRARS